MCSCSPYTCLTAHAAHVWSVDDMSLMLPVLQKYECTALLAFCDTQLALQSTLLSTDTTSPSLVLKLLTLASRFHLHELQQLCKDRVHTLARDPGGLMLLTEVLTESVVMEDLAKAGQTQVITSIMAQANKRLRMRTWL